MMLGGFGLAGETCCYNHTGVEITAHQMALSALGFNCFGTSANYNHLSVQTTAASVYTSVRRGGGGGGGGGGGRDPGHRRSHVLLLCKSLALWGRRGRRGREGGGEREEREDFLDSLTFMNTKTTLITSL